MNKIMKKYIFHIILLAALILTACSKEEMAGTTYAPGEGGLSIVLNTAEESAGTRAETTLDKCTVAIYDLGQEGLLVRKYKGNCPETINLLAGNYKLGVEYGEKPQSAAKGKSYFHGKNTFTIVSGATEQVDVTIVPTCVAVEVDFDVNTINNNSFESYSATVTWPEGAGTNSVEYTQSTGGKNEYTGYFNIPADLDHPAQLNWVFRGDHKTKNEITTSGKFTVEAGKKYRLLFKFSPDLPGYIVPMILTIDESTENHDDHYNFSADPELAGDLIDNPTFTGSDKTFTAKATGSQIALIGLKINNGSERYIYSNTPEIPVDPELATLVSVALSEENSLATVTFRSAFFTFPYGEVPLVLAVTDSNSSKATKSVTLKMNEGIRTVTAADYDLWTNTVTLRAVSSTTPTFVLRNGDKEQTLTGTSAGGSEYTATFSPTWTESTNGKGLTVYTPEAGTGVWAGTSYVATAICNNGVQSSTSFTTAKGDIIPSCDTNGAVWFSSQASDNSSTWASGNNTMTSTLCTRAERPSGNGCAYMQASKTGGCASGNLFLGTFTFGKPAFGSGTAAFGQKYTYTARPSHLAVKYHATVGKVNNKGKDGSPLNEGDQDISTIYVIITDWSARHDVVSGLNSASGIWSPDAQSNLAGSGKIIGYGILDISQSSPADVDWETAEIPIYYYDTTCAAPTGAYTFSIGCSTSKYGDYMCGCTTNKLYVDDFAWIY